MFSMAQYIMVVMLLVKNGVPLKRFRPPEFCQNKQRTNNGSNESFLWEIDGNPPSYFFGTIHVPYTRVWAHVPFNAKRAFHMAQSVYFELDLTDPYTISALTACQLLPKGQTLPQIIPRPLFLRLQQHLSYVQQQMPLWVTSGQRKRGLSANFLFTSITGNWQRKRPVWVMLMVNSLTKDNIQARGEPVLDLFLAQEAQRLRKRTGAVERVGEQCMPLNALNTSQEVFALERTLQLQETLRGFIEEGLDGGKEGDNMWHPPSHDLVRHYNCASLKALLQAHEATQASALTVPQLSNASLPPAVATRANNLDSYFRRELIERRNARMGARVVRLLQQNPTRSFFFAFGAGHFFGEMSVVEMVKRYDYTVRHLGPNDPLKKRKSFRFNAEGDAPSSGNKPGVVERVSVLTQFTPSLQHMHLQNHVDPAFAKFLSKRCETTSERGRSVGVESELGMGQSIRETHLPTSTYRPFNDLWMKIKKKNNKSSIPSLAPTDENRVLEESLRVWYGLPAVSSGLNLMPYVQVNILSLTLFSTHILLI